jgi:SPASM domain peptide maturase of grasp-with-spasm system
MAQEIKEQYFVLYACCFPVKGYQRSIICDTQRNDFIFIPNSLYEILTECKGLNLQQTYNRYEGEYNQEIDEYFAFLVEKEYGFFTDTPSLFPDIDLTFKNYALVNNAIVDIGERPAYDIQKVIRVLDDMFCEALQIRFPEQVSLPLLQSIAAMLEGSGFTTIEIVIFHGYLFTPEQIAALVRKHLRITSVLLFNSTEEKVFDEAGRLITFSAAAVDSVNDCGCVSPYYFSTHLRHIAEARSFNTCLHRKLAIDINGKVKNCPSIQHDFGYFDADKILNIIKMTAFRELWEMNKDKIEVCRDCEFRYICTDCRAFLKDAKNIYSKPEKCSYDPYTAKWG